MGYLRSHQKTNARSKMNHMKRIGATSSTSECNSEPWYELYPITNVVNQDCDDLMTWEDVDRCLLAPYPSEVSTMSSPSPVQHQADFGRRRQTAIVSADASLPLD